MAVTRFLSTTARILVIPVTALALAVAPLASADDDLYHGTLELNVGAGVIPDGSSMHGDTLRHLGLGLNLGERWGLEVVGSELTMDATNGTDIDVNQYRLDALYYMADPYQKVRPYAAFGAGDQQLSGSTIASDRKDTVFNAGLGFKYLLAQGFVWRSDVRLFHNTDENANDVVLSTGFSFAFGGQPRPASSEPERAPTPADADNDGVVDSRDQCPDTPAGVRVDANGCALDSDNDGVPDHRDDCPNTARQYKVNEQGCPIELSEAVSIEMDVQFALNSAEVREQYIPEVRRVADFMQQFDKTQVRVEGHTDSTGTAEYNQQLSQERADAVREVLIERFDLSADRVTAVGFGEARPIAPNDTDAGRQQNRRVVAEITADVTRNETRD